MKWKTVAITFIILFVLLVSFMIFSVSLALESEQKEQNCVDKCFDAGLNTYAFNTVTFECYCLPNEE